MVVALVSILPGKEVHGLEPLLLMMSHEPSLRNYQQNKVNQQLLVFNMDSCTVKTRKFLHLCTGLHP